MQALTPTALGGAAGLCLLCAPLLRPARPAPAIRSGGLVAALGARSPSETARRAGARCWFLARRAVNREEENLEAWDPAALAGRCREAWRLRMMAADATGNLHRALFLARRAARLARTREEAGRAFRLLALLDHEAGCPTAELQAARALLLLAPDDPVSLITFRRAERCAGQGSRHPLPSADRT